MIEFLLTIGIVFLAMAGLGIGVLMGRGALNASCGGNALVKNCPACDADAPDGDAHDQ